MKFCGLIAAVLILGCVPASSQVTGGLIRPGQVWGNPTAAPASASPMYPNFGTVRIQRVLPLPGTYGTATWAAYGPNGALICSGAGNTTALDNCVASAIATAFPNASLTPNPGYDFELVGGDEPGVGSPGSHHFGGGGAVLSSNTGPFHFPPIQNGKIRIGATSIVTGGNADALVFDACEMCDIEAAGMQTVAGGTGFGLRIRPTQGTPVDNGVAFSPSRAFFTTIGGPTRLDLSGSASANIDYAHIEIIENNLGAATVACGFLLDSPANGQNMGANTIKIGQLHGLGTAVTTMFCNGTTAPGGSAVLGQSYFDIGIGLDTAGGTNGFDEWGSNDEIHIHATGLSTGYTLKFESGACHNVAYIWSSQATPTITDNGGCAASAANTVWVNGSLTIGGNTVLNVSGLTAPSISLGTPGAVFHNATSGSITVVPVIGALGSVTLSLPDATDTLVGKTTTDVLTNKTISGVSNTLSNIANASLTNSSITYGTTAVALGASSTSIAGLTSLGLTSGSTINWNSDAFVGRGAAANFKLGQADAASPVAQTLSVQNVVSGTSNTAGANLTINGSQGTGTGSGGNIIFQAALAGLTGASVNPLVNIMTLTTTGSVGATFGNTTSVAATAANFVSASGQQAGFFLPLAGTAGPTGGWYNYRDGSNNWNLFNYATSVNSIQVATANDTVTFAKSITVTAGTETSSSRISNGSVPVGTTGSCVASSFVGGSTAGKFSAAVCAAGTIILSGLPTAPNGYTCNAQDQTTPADTLQQTVNTVSSVTFKATTVAADTVVFQCTGW